MLGYSRARTITLIFLKAVFMGKEIPPSFIPMMCNSKQNSTSVTNHLNWLETLPVLALTVPHPDKTPQAKGDIWSPSSSRGQLVSPYHWDVSSGESGCNKHYYCSPTFPSLLLPNRKEVYISLLFWSWVMSCDSLCPMKHEWKRCLWLLGRNI